jgi:hypothetical protein
MGRRHYASQAIIERFLSQPIWPSWECPATPSSSPTACTAICATEATRCTRERHTDTIEGDRSYRRLADVPSPVDGVVVMVPEAAVTDVVREAVACGIPRVWLHRGPGQKPVPSDAVQICLDHGIEVVDGACPLMFESPVRGIHRLHHFMIRRRFVA